MRKAVLALTVAMVGSFAVAAISMFDASAAESGLTPGTGAITSGLVGKCLDLTANSSVSGTPVQLRSCDGGESQAWTATSDGSLRIQGKCLDAKSNGKANLTGIILWDCHKGANQLWESSNGGYRNPASGRCLDALGASTADGTGIILFDCHGKANQQWSTPGRAPGRGSGGAATPSPSQPVPPPPSSGATVVRYPAPPYLAASTDYSLKVNSQSIDVRKSFDSSLAQFAYAGTATFTVTAKEDIDSYSISPHSYGIKATKSGKNLVFTLAQARSRYLIIKVNKLENLVIAADPPETTIPVANGGSVKNLLDLPGVDTTGSTLITSKLQQAIDDAAGRSGGGTVYVPAGVYSFSQIQMRSNVTLYLAAGAVLRGSSNLSDYSGTTPNVRFAGTSNAAIKGRGIIDSNGSALTTDANGPNRKNIIHSSKSNGTKPDGLTFEGITLRDGTTWNFNLTESTHVTITNVKIFNNVHWIHGDGFDLVNVSHALVDQCFAYIGDDAFDAKSSSSEPMTDVVYQNSVAYTQSAGTKVGMQGNGDVSDIWFKNIDVVQGYRGISVDHDKGGGSWSNIHFVDIRTEKIYNNGTSGQFRTAPLLIWTAKYDGTEVGPISTVELTRVSFEDINGFHSYIQGYDSSGKVSDVRITDLKIGGKTITKAADGLIDVGDNTSGITFAAS